MASRAALWTLVAAAGLCTAATQTVVQVDTVQSLSLALRQPQPLRIELTAHLDLTVGTSDQIVFPIVFPNCTADIAIWGNCSGAQPAWMTQQYALLDTTAIAPNACGVQASTSTPFFGDNSPTYANDPNLAPCGNVWLSNLVIAASSAVTNAVDASKVALHVVDVTVVGFTRGITTTGSSNYVIGSQIFNPSTSGGSDLSLLQFLFDPRDYLATSELHVADTFMFFPPFSASPAFISVEPNALGTFSTPPVAPTVARVVAVNNATCESRCPQLDTTAVTDAGIVTVRSNMTSHQRPGAGVGAISNATTWADVKPTPARQAFLESLVAAGVPGAAAALDPFKLAPPGFFAPTAPGTSPVAPGAAPAPGTRATPPPPGVPFFPGAPTSPSPSSSSISGGAIAGIAAGAIVLVLLACCVFVLLCVRRKKRSDAEGGLPYKAEAAGQDGVDGFPAPASSPVNKVGAAAAKIVVVADGGAPPSAPASNGGDTLSALTGTAWTLDSTQQSSTRQGPPSSATLGGRRTTCHSISDARTIAEGLEFIEDQIECAFQYGGGLVFGRYRLTPGLTNIRRGGQGIVHFARDKSSDREFALKFFANEESFLNEQSLYANPTLHAILPGVEDAFNDSRTKDPLDRQMAPCVVLERGEPLDEWVARVAPDVSLSMTIMTHVVKVVADLHAAGLVHRDLKPSNTIWLDSRKGFTVIDFGSAAVHGEEAGMSLSPAYAAPEVVAAFEAGAKSMRADCSVDIWALGIMAYELFTGSRVFPRGTPQAEICAALMGRKPLPWEEHDSEAVRAAMRKLGAMRRGVMAMLERDPARRMPLPEVHALWTAIFEATVTHLG